MDSDDAVEMVLSISHLLDAGDYQKALSEFNEKSSGPTFKTDCLDLLLEILYKIQDDTIIIKPSLYGACEKILALIVEKCDPEDGLLALFELVELAKNDAQFGLLLSPLKELQMALPNRQVRSVAWTVTAIYSYIAKITVPDHSLEGDERKLLDSEPNVRRITKLYSMLPSFYQPFIDALLEAEDNPTNKRIKITVSGFLIKLLGKPMILLDVDPSTNTRSEARLCCNTLLQDICKLEKDVLKFLIQLEMCTKENKCKHASDDNGELPQYDLRDKINLTTLSGLFYAIYAGKFEIPYSAMPQVYSNEYVNHCLILAVNHLLTFNEYGPLAKGLALIQFVIDHMTPFSPYELLSSSVHFEMVTILTKVAVYSNYTTIRTEAIKTLGDYINKLEYRGRCAVIKHLIDSSQHSGVIGYCIQVYKNAINEAFKEPVLNTIFTGVQLEVMIKKICLLPHGAESDLMELADQIITALNFLIYLALKDKNNATGFQDLFSAIETEYLDKLRTGLKMSKAHYELKLMEVKEGKNPDEGQPNITLNVGGNVLDAVPAKRKLEIIESALNGFHLIESLVARLTEIMNV